MTDDKKEFQELALHLTAGDKVGVAYQIGVLSELEHRGWLQHVRHVHTSGMSNLLAAQWMMAREDKGGFWNQVCQASADWLMADQEYWVAWNRAPRFWNWLQPWSEAFSQWTQMTFPHSRVRSCMIHRKHSKTETRPIFTLDGWLSTQGPQTVSVTSNTERISMPPARSHRAKCCDPRLVRLADLNTDTWAQFLVGSSLPAELTGPGCTVTGLGWVSPSLNIDPFQQRARRVYYDISRGPSSPRLMDNKREIVVDAYSDSYWARQSPQTTAVLYDHSQSVRMAPALCRNRPGAPMQRYALYPAGFLELFPPDADDPAQLVDTGMRALSSDTVRRFIDRGCQSISGMLS